MGDGTITTKQFEGAKVTLTKPAGPDRYTVTLHIREFEALRTRIGALESAVRRQLARIALLEGLVAYGEGHGTPDLLVAPYSCPWCHLLLGDDTENWRHAHDCPAAIAMDWPRMTARA